MRKSVILFLCLLCACVLSAQNMSDLIISEAMPAGSGSVTDSYGRHSAWVEIFNTSQGTVNFAGCFLTDDPSVLTKCQIPKGYLSTKLGPRQTALFYATGNNAEGVFYLNFEIFPGTSIYLVSNDGRTVIDSLVVPENLPEGLSASKFAHDAKELVFDDLHAASPSPGMLNGKHDQKTRAQVMKETDPHGWTLSIVAVSVVFAALFILFLIYNLSGNIFSGKYKRKPRGRKSSPDAETAAAIALALDSYTSSNDDVAAAIALALHLHLGAGVHDIEPGFITIKGNPNSPWSNKSLTFRKKAKQI